jgi:hypothetical protein
VRRIEAAKTAIHSRIVEPDAPQASTEASQLQDAPNILDDLLRMNRKKDSKALQQQSSLMVSFLSVLSCAQITCSQGLHDIQL